MGLCTEEYQELKCGKPLGLRFDNDGRLIVADPYLGIYRLDLNAKKAKILIDPKDEVDGQPNKLLNSVAIAKDGSIYYSVSSTRFYLQEGILTILEFGSPSGRLLKYDPKTEKSQALIEGLAFANGVALTDDESFVMVSDIGKLRILKYYLKVAKKVRGRCLPRLPARSTI